MTPEQAKKLAAKLDATVPAHIIVDLNDEQTEIVFCSELTGTHSLSIECSDRARVLAHWKGFLANQPAGSR